MVVFIITSASGNTKFNKSIVVEYPSDYVTNQALINVLRFLYYDDVE